MNWDRFEGKGKGLHFGALRLLRDRLTSRVTPPGECADEGRFGEERRMPTDDVLTTIDDERDKLAGPLRAYSAGNSRKNVCD